VGEVSAGGPLETLVHEGDVLIFVDGVPTPTRAQAELRLGRSAVHMCVLLRRRTWEERRCDQWATRAVVALLALAYVHRLHANGTLRQWLAQYGLVSLALPGGDERGWDEHLLIASIGSTSRKALHEAQANGSHGARTLHCFRALFSP
jgi:hypothetical protein